MLGCWVAGLLGKLTENIEKSDYILKSKINKQNNMTESSTKVPTWFWVVSILALVWNLLGLMAFFTTVNMSPETLTTFPEAEQKIYRNTPIWATIAFAVAVFGGTLGSLGLVLRKNWAKPLLIASLIGVLLQNFHAFILANGLEVYGMERAVMPMIVILIGGLLIWLANSVQSKTWFK